MSKLAYRDSGLPHGLVTKTVKGSNTVTPAAGKNLYITSVVNSNASNTTRTLTYKSDASTTHTLDVGGQNSVSFTYPIIAVSITVGETDIAVTYIEA